MLTHCERIACVECRYLLPTLSRFGRTDLALELATQTTYPSWAYMWLQTIETPAVHRLASFAFDAFSAAP